MPQPPHAALRLTRKKRKNSPIVCTQNYSLRGEKGSLPSVLGSGRFALRSLAAWDLFPYTEHVETLAVFKAV